MPKRYWGVIITYILLYLSIYLFEPVFINLFNLTMEAANAYGRIVGYFLACIVILILVKPDIKKVASNAYPPKKNDIMVYLRCSYLFFSPGYLWNNSYCCI